MTLEEVISKWEKEITERELIINDCGYTYDDVHAAMAQKFVISRIVNDLKKIE